MENLYTFLFGGANLSSRPECFTRLEKADEALTSGKDLANFDRVSFKETIETADITFDYDTYLLTVVKARALKSGAGQRPKNHASPAR